MTAHNADGESGPSVPSAPFTPSGAQFSTTIDTSQGGVLVLNPQGQDNLGTAGKINIPRQPGPATDVVISASLFGQPGETDDTCAGNVCIGQGIEWAVSDPSAITRMFVKFLEKPALTHGMSVKDADVYKDGVLVPDCGDVEDLSSSGSHHQLSEPTRPIPCVSRRESSSKGGWRISVRVDGNDPKGRI